jgi:hypothetical protein
MRPSTGGSTVRKIIIKVIAGILCEKLFNSTSVMKTGSNSHNRTHFHNSQRTATGLSAIPWCKCQFRENRYYEHRTSLQRVEETLPLDYTFFIRFRQNLGTELQCSGCCRPLCTVTRATVTVNNASLNSENCVTEFSNCNLVITKWGLFTARYDLNL